jgi:hypothetical protein
VGRSGTTKPFAACLGELDRSVSTIGLNRLTGHQAGRLHLAEDAAQAGLAQQHPLKQLALRDSSAGFPDVKHDLVPRELKVLLSHQLFSEPAQQPVVRVQHGTPGAQIG